MTNGNAKNETANKTNSKTNKDGAKTHNASRIKIKISNVNEMMIGNVNKINNAKTNNVSVKTNNVSKINSVANNNGVKNMNVNKIKISEMVNGITTVTTKMIDIIAMTAMTKIATVNGHSVRKIVMTKDAPNNNGKMIIVSVINNNNAHQSNAKGNYNAKDAMLNTVINRNTTNVCAKTNIVCNNGVTMII